MRHVSTRTALIRIAVLGAAAIALSGCAALMQQGPGPDNPTSSHRKVSSQEPVKMTAEEAKVLAATNAYRKGLGLSTLEPDARLTAIARLRSQDMARRNYFSHESPEGGDVFAILRNSQVRFWAAGENLARNNYDMALVPDVAMAGWIKSPGHRANLVHPAFGRLGVGMAVAKDGKKYLTQVFTD
ncbi:Cysteine-rich secretory protein family protein [compost metagenome]